MRVRGDNPKDGLIGGAQGAVYVEFLLVIWPLLTLMLGLTQIGLMYGAHLLVCQAAAKAARAAIVIFPDENVDDYAGVEPNHIGQAEDGESSAETSGEASSGGLDAYKNAPDGGRLDQIRMAARIILAPVAPSIQSYIGTSLAEGIGAYPVTSSLAGAMLWNAYGVAVTFPDRSNGAKAAEEEAENDDSNEGETEEENLPTYKTEFASQETITARVTFLYKCPVPLARSIMCKSYSDLPEQAKAELDTVNASTIGNVVTDFLGWRYLAIAAERTLPNQGRAKKQN